MISGRNTRGASGIAYSLLILLRLKLFALIRMMRTKMQLGIWWEPLPLP